MPTPCFPRSLYLLRSFSYALSLLINGREKDLYECMQHVKWHFLEGYYPQNMRSLNPLSNILQIGFKDDPCALI
jgi:hypothetical protein